MCSWRVNLAEDWCSCQISSISTMGTGQTLLRKNWRQLAWHGHATGTGLIQLHVLTGGSIPSTSCGWIPFWLNEYNIWVGNCNLVDCNWNSGWLLNFLVSWLWIFCSFTGGRVGFCFFVSTSCNSLPRHILFLSCLGVVNRVNWFRLLDLFWASWLHWSRFRLI